MRNDCSMKWAVSYCTDRSMQRFVWIEISPLYLNPELQKIFHKPRFFGLYRKFLNLVFSHGLMTRALRTSGKNLVNNLQYRLRTRLWAWVARVVRSPFLKISVHPFYKRVKKTGSFMRIQGLRVKLPEVLWTYTFELFICWFYEVQILKCALTELLYHTVTIFKYGISISQ